MKFKELAQLGEQDRKAKMLELELELIKLNTQVATGTPPKNAGTVSRIKKDIARLMLANKLTKPAVKATVVGKNKQPAKKAVKKVHTK